MYLDINECEEDNDGCSQICNNTQGSFECSCRDGYTLDGDGKNCSGTRNQSINYTLCIVDQISMNVMKTMVAAVRIAIILEEALNVLVILVMD